MGRPKVSVIVPCYNLGRYLGEAVDSVLAQTFQDFEILVVDDGLGERETIERLAGFRRPKARVIHTENRGLPAAKNVGIKSTSGEYICALDADDRLEPTFLEKSVHVLDADSSVAFVSHWLRAFGDEEWEWTPERCDFPALLDINTVSGAALVRREAVDAVGGYDESMRHGCEDWELWISLVERGFRGTIIPEVLFHYRRRRDSMSRVMMQGDGHPALYRYLAEKHAASYRQHLSALLLRREGDISNLRRHIHDLDLEHERWLGPELAKCREDVKVLNQKAADAERDREREVERLSLVSQVEEISREREAEHSRLMSEVGEVERERAAVHARWEEERARAGSFDERLGQEQERAAHLEAALEDARREVRGLYGSMSWRITGPLRAVYGLLVRLLGDHR